RRPHRRPQCRLEGPRAVGGERRPHSVADRRQQGNKAAGRAYPAPPRPAGEVTSTAQSAMAFALAVSPALALRWPGGLPRRQRRPGHGFVDINGMALKAAINGSIFALPDACLVMMIALPFRSTRALAIAHDISP